MNFEYVAENGVNSNGIDIFLYCWYKKEIIQLFNRTAEQLFGYEQVAKRIANIRLTFHLQFLTDTCQYKNRNVQCEFTQFL